MSGEIGIDLLQLFLQLLISALVGEFAGDVKHMPLKPLLQVGIDGAIDKFLKVLHQLGAEFIGGHRVPGDADHCELTRQ